MVGPNILPGAPTGIELVADIIKQNVTPTPVSQVNLFMGYADNGAENTGLVYQVMSGPSMDPAQTFGTVVAQENEAVDVIVYGVPGDYATPKAEAMRLRYLIMSLGEYVFNGLRMLDADPKGNVVDMGRDPQRRCNFMVSFKVMLEPSYDRSFDA